MQGKHSAVAAAFAATFAASTVVSAAQSAPAETYPQRPVRVIVNVSPGGGVDSVARIAAQHLQSVWNQPFVVDNRTGAGGSIGIELVAGAAPDGYTLLVCSSGMVTNAAVRPGSYDPVRDLQPITALNAAPYIVLTSPALQVSGVKDLVALARTKPGAVSYASSGTGGILHLSAELLASMSGTKMLHVPFKGIALAYPAVVANDVNWALGFPTSALPLVKSGRLKALAVTSARRSPLLPDLPTVAETGVPGYDVTAWFGMFAPAGLPPALVTKLYNEVKRGMQSPETVQRINRDGAEVIVSTPKEFAAEVKAEYAKWLNLAKRTGIKLE